ncbi:MAG: hypothetical protein PHQ33_08580, partial [Bacteroidales bacterium]|nr:hypothetical protein [Bacteroidales bacterium]
MKKTALLFFAVLFSMEMQGQYLLGILNYNAYSTAKMEPYIEFQFLIDGKTTKYVLNENHKYASEVEITVDINQKNAKLQKDSTVATLHYILVSDEFEDSIAQTKPFFIDLQYVQVPNGEYELNFCLKDLHVTTRSIRYIDFIQVHFPVDQICLSGVSLWHTFNATGEGGIFTKYGYSVMPLYQKYAPESVYALPVTLEIYNTSKILGAGKEFLVKAAIVPAEVYRGGDKQYEFYKKMKTDAVAVFLHQFNIFPLASGNYNVVVDVMDMDSNVLATASAFFQRNNPSVKLDLKDYDDVVIDSSFVIKMTDLKVLQDNTASLYPIGTRVEQEFFSQRMKNVPMEQLQKFFYAFWMKRAPEDPEGAWNDYRQKVEYVQAHYGSKVIKGYRTEIG